VNGADARIAEKDTALLTEVQTGAEGNFSVELGKKQGYSGEAFEGDIYCGTVVTCDTDMPVSSLKVSAFDADWLQDDDSGRTVQKVFCKQRPARRVLEFGSPGAIIRWHRRLRATRIRVPRGREGLP